MSARGRLGAVALAAVALAGCGDATIATDRAERSIRAALAAQTGVRGATVRCPRTVAAKAGATFDCEVAARDGSRADARVRQRDADGDVAVESRFRDMREVEAAVAARLRRDTKRATSVACPQVVVPSRNLVVPCAASIGRRIVDLSVLFTDDRGAVFKFRLR